jgi:hypothetical protein
MDDCIFKFNRILAREAHKHGFPVFEVIQSRRNLHLTNPIFIPNLSQLHPIFTPDLSQLKPIFIPNLSHLNPTFSPDMSQLNPIFIPKAGGNRAPASVSFRTLGRFSHNKTSTAYQRAIACDHSYLPAGSRGLYEERHSTYSAMANESTRWGMR